MWQSTEVDKNSNCDTAKEGELLVLVGKIELYIRELEGMTYIGKQLGKLGGRRRG